MELQLDTAELTDLIGYVAATAPRTPTSPVLACVVLDADEDGTLTASTYDHEVSAYASGQAMVTKPGRVLVSAKVLNEIAKALPKGKSVTLTDDGTRLFVKCGSGTFTLLMMPADQYPSLPDLPPLAGSVGSDALASAISQVATAAGKDDTLPALTGVRIEIRGNTLTLVATDRYRLAIRELEWNGANPDLDTAVLVSARLLTGTSRALTHGAETQVYLDGDGDLAHGLIGFAGPGKHTTTRLLSGEYPRYQPLLPTEFSAFAELAAAAFAEAVKRVALVAEKNTPVRFAFSEGRVRLEAGTSDGAAATEEIGADYTVFSGDPGEEFRVAFNPDYLDDGISATGADTIRLSFTTPTRPCIITGKNGDTVPDFRYVIMPIRSAG